LIVLYLGNLAERFLPARKDTGNHPRLFLKKRGNHPRRLMIVRMEHSIENLTRTGNF
jgi:hypothetical protein